MKFCPERADNEDYTIDHFYYADGSKLVNIVVGRSFEVVRAESTVEGVDEDGWGRYR